MHTLYNPSGSMTNCGFCSISYALHKVKHQIIDAEQLYFATLQRLGLQLENGRDPISRQLIFPEPNLDTARPRPGYEALVHGAHGFSSYTVTAVAEANHLNHEWSRDPVLAQRFVRFSADTSAKKWNLDAFVDWRVEWLENKVPNAASAAAVKRQVLATLAGHSIIGSKTSNHYVNMHIDGDGVIQAFDAQDGKQYDGRQLSQRVRTVDLLVRLL